MHCITQDLKANEARLQELKTVAQRLTAMGQTEAAEKIRIQIDDLNQRWAALEQVTQEKAQTLGSAYEVQRYHRDADETKDWIEEKEHNLQSSDIGHDLATVQRLQRKHEGVSRLLLLFSAITVSVSIGNRGLVFLFLRRH